MVGNIDVQDRERVRMRADAEAIFRAGVRAVEPGAAVERVCRLEGDLFWVGDQRFDLGRSGRILVVGAGKATAAMAQAIERLLGERIDEGLISVKYGHGAPLRRIRIVEAGHPGPDENGMAAARAIMEMVAPAGPNDLVIALISGGGSALLPLPASGLTLADKQRTTDLLLASGATIHEINALRKHLSAVKGGRLAQAAAPASLVALILSDVVGDDLDAIASGPTVPDPTTFGDCLEVVRRYDLERKLPRSVLAHLRQGAAGRVAETPKPDIAIWGHVHHRIVGSNAIALKAAGREAERLGYAVQILSDSVQGETRTVARSHAELACRVLDGKGPVAPPACILSGGETTVTLRGDGKGGRNQEFALAAAPIIDGRSAIVILSAGTDGTDGPTDAAGAFADHTTAGRAEKAALDINGHLNRNDAYPFFKRLNDLLTTGPTGTNVMDLNVMLVRKEEAV
jgi:glycerate 2-kinase